MPRSSRPGGGVAPGKLADLLVVDGGPIADITVLENTDKLLAIIKGGVLVKDALPGRTDGK